MKVFVQGRKDGYKVLYPAPTPKEFFRFGKDIQSINARNQQNLYGKSVYSIAFEQGGRIYSKYVVGYDVQRANLGNISFSIFVPDDRYIDGASIVELLDLLSSTYFERYAPDYYISGNPENWTELATLANQYDAKIVPIDHLDVQQFNRGEKEAGFIYYATREQLASYFDNPYQKEYAQYSQVFLVDSVLKERPENPLSVFKYCPDGDLSGRIDLENRRYRLILDSSSYATVKLTMPDGIISSLRNNGHFHKKDRIHIEWSKLHYHTFDKSGTIESLKDYLEIDENNKTVRVLPVNLDILSMDFQPQFVLRGSPIEMELFQCTNTNGDEVHLDKGKLHFEGAQLNQSWTVRASKGDYITAFLSFLPASTTGDILSIQAMERKEISFIFYDKETRDKVYSVEISYTDPNGIRKSSTGGKLVFKNEELDYDYSLEFYKRHYFTEPPFNLNPRSSQSSIAVELEPKPHSSNKPQFGDEQQGRNETKPSNWLRRHLVPLILGVALAASLTWNVFQFRTIRKYNNERLVALVSEYVGGSELLASKLQEYSNKSAVKDDASLNKRVTSALQYRGFIDMRQFQISQWDTGYISQLGELSKFYELCTNNNGMISKMEDHLKGLWGDEVKNHSLRDIIDTLDSFVVEENRKALETEQFGKNTQDSEFEEEQNTEQEMNVSDTSDNSANVIMPSKEKRSFWEWLSGLFRKEE